MKENYNYPLDLSWSTTEMTEVLSFFNQVEKFYESKVEKEVFLESYAAFKKLFPQKCKKNSLDVILN
ncbi:hypothetical protein ICE98_01450 [Lactococcus lactis]|nr:hypothetical protein [Lactococcus lactis]